MYRAGFERDCCCRYIAKLNNGNNALRFLQELVLLEFEAKYGFPCSKPKDKTIEGIHIDIQGAISTAVERELVDVAPK